MRDWDQHFLGDPGPELDHALLVAGGAGIPTVAGQRQQVLVPARVAPDTSEPFGEVAAGKEFLDHAAKDRPVEAVLLLIPRSVARLDLGDVRLHTLVEGRCLGFRGL